MMGKKSDRVVAQHLPQSVKKVYRTPRVIEFGHISRLTSGTTGTHTDKGSMAGTHGMG